MDTAPKDGSFFLVAEKWHPEEVEYEMWIVHHREGFGWRFRSGAGFMPNPSMRWRPLPAPPVPSGEGEGHQQQILGTFPNVQEPLCPALDCKAHARLRMLDPNDTWYRCDRGHEFSPTRTVWSDRFTQSAPEPCGEGEAHTIENIMAKRAAIGYDTRFDSSATLYCDECSAGANTVEMHGKDGCTGTFREPEPCGTCEGRKKVPLGKARKGERFRTALMGICPDCATSEGDA